MTQTLARRSDGSLLLWGVNSYVKPPYDLIGTLDVQGSNHSSNIGFSAAVKADGTVIAWGGLAGSPALSVPADMTNVAKISLGLLFGVALKSNGTVACWGSNSYGLNVPAGLTGVVKVSAAENHAFALKSDGTLVRWGKDESGAIPAGLTGVVDVSAGSTHDLAVKSDGTVVGWGNNGDGESIPPAGLTGVVQVASCNRFSAALKSDGTVVTWGFNAPSVGDLTNVVAMSRSYDDLQFLKADGSVVVRGASQFGQTCVPYNVSRIIQTSSGGTHSAVLRDDGTVFCFGDNSSGQLNAPAGVTFSSVSCGRDFTVGLKTDGTVVAWGRNDLGQCSVPAGLTNVIQVAAGGFWTVALKSDGTVAAWGSSSGNVVSGAATQTGLVQISLHSAGGHVLGLKSNGTVTAWGQNTSGECNVPVGLTGIVQVAAGSNHSLALRSNGTVAAWGSNSQGQSSTQTATFSSIAAGSSKSFGIRTSRSKLVSWGLDDGLLNTEGIVSVTSNGGGGTLAIPAVVVSVAPYNVTLGGSVTGTVFIPKPAPVGGANVTIVTNNVDIAAPGTVTIPAGLRSTTFTINAGALAGAGVWKINATYGFYTSVATLTTVPSPLSSVSVPSMLGDQEIQGTILLTGPAPSGYTVNLTSDNVNVTVPATVSFTTGATSASFTVTSADVTSSVSATISATDASGGSATTGITVTPNDLLALNLNPVVVIGGTTNVVTGTVTLAGVVADPTTVSLSVTAGGAYASVPATATIPAGSASGTFTVTHQNVTTKSYATIRASRHGQAYSQVLTLNASKLNSVTVSPQSTVGGSTKVVNGTVNLRAAVTVDTVISLSSSNPSLASVPSTVTVLAGNRSASFPINHADVSTSTPVTISGSWQADHPTATLTLTPNPLSALVLSRTSVVGSASTTVRLIVKLASNVTSDTTVSLSSSDPSAASVPATVTIPAGTRVVTIVVTHFAVGSTKTVSITGNHGGATLTTTLTVTP